jgi:hypothetical protein
MTLTFNSKDGAPKNLNYQVAMKKPISIRVCQIKEPFIVETLEGKMEGKANDWLMVGVNGELYPCDNAIFEKTYDILEFTHGSPNMED